MLKIQYWRQPFNTNVFYLHWLILLRYLVSGNEWNDMIDRWHTCINRSCKKNSLTNSTSTKQQPHLMYCACHKIPPCHPQLYPWDYVTIRCDQCSLQWLANKCRNPGIGAQISSTEHSQKIQHESWQGTFSFDLLVMCLQCLAYLPESCLKQCVKFTFSNKESELTFLPWY